MKYRRYADSDLCSSIAHTVCSPTARAKFGVPVLVENSLKDGITMMYWTFVCIGMDGRFAVDVRDIPGGDKDLVDMHSRALAPHVQRDIALKLIEAAFADLSALSTWCRKDAWILTDWRPAGIGTA